MSVHSKTFLKYQFRIFKIVPDAFKGSCELASHLRRRCYSPAASCLGRCLGRLIQQDLVSLWKAKHVRWLPDDRVKLNHGGTWTLSTTVLGTPRSTACWGVCEWIMHEGFAWQSNAYGLRDKSLQMNYVEEKFIESSFMVWTPSASKWKTRRDESKERHKHEALGTTEIRVIRLLKWQEPRYKLSQPKEWAQITFSFHLSNLWLENL